MKTKHVDVSIIGAGTAGLAAHHAARAAGASAVLIEGGDHGTTCARVGCMPSKLLIAAADAAHAVVQAENFGVHVDGAIRIDGREVMARVQRERDRFVSFVRDAVLALPGAERLQGLARFVGNHVLVVGDHTRVTSRSIVIATGARATMPAAFVGLGERLISSDAVFGWQDLPKSVAILGTGSIGVELGLALQRLGVQVLLLGRGGRVGPLSDPQIRACALNLFGQELTLEHDANIISMRREGARVAIVRSAENGQQTDYVDYVLAATGRPANLDGLGLERTTLQLDARGLPASDSTTARCISVSGESPIFIAGDASSHLALLHEANDEGHLAGDNAARLALGQPLVPGQRRAPLAIVFTDPQLAVVGAGFAALPLGSFACGQVSFADQGRSRILLKNRGLLNVYGERGSGRFLGAEMVAPAGEHLAHLLVWALQNRMTVEQMLEMPFYHPVIEEGVRTALHDLARQLRAPS